MWRTLFICLWLVSSLSLVLSFQQTNGIFLFSKHNVLIGNVVNSDFTVRTKRSLNILRVAATNEDESSRSGRNDNLSNDVRIQKEKTLYQVLGARQFETREEIKKKYLKLVRQYHPDARIGMDSSELSTDVDMRELNGAWRILADPEKRRKYDRELQAQEIAETVEDLIDAGIRTAVPFFQNTVKNTMSAVEMSSNKMKDVQEKLNKARGIADLELAKRDMEQQYSDQKSRANQMKRQLKELPNQKLQILRKDSTSKLKSSEAKRIWKSYFDTLDESKKSKFVTLTSDIDELQRAEIETERAAREILEAQRAYRQAERKLEEANNRLSRAQQRLESAQQDDNQIHEFVMKRQDEMIEISQWEQQATSQLEAEMISTIDEQTETLRSIILLYQKSQKNQNVVEIANIQQTAKQMKEESKRLESMTDSFMKEATRLDLQIKQKMKDAERKVTDAINNQKRAEQNVVSAHRELQEATKSVEINSELQGELYQRERLANDECSQIAQSLEKQIGTVRSKLRSLEEEALKLRSIHLQTEIMLAEEAGKELQIQTQLLSKELQKLRREYS